MDIDKTGEHAFSASADHTVRIWRIADGTCSKVTSHCAIVFVRRLHTTGPRRLHETAKMMLSAIHNTNFFTTATIFSTVFYMSNDFLTNFFRKTFAVLCVMYNSFTTETAKISLKKSLPINETVVKVVAVVKKSVVCMNDNCMFCSFCCGVQGGPLVKTA